ncbi:CHASE3 domain-containing protein [Lacibacterium aquatile]|uniref:histidine kinase n=1 Tax=Lacibacterium aquatile TaxID=1168082 RepID=A0ABW5DVT6_9PROT
MAALAWQAQDSLHEKATAADREYRGFELISDIMEFQAVVTDAETSQRGYLLTNNENYLGPYRRSIVRFPDLVQELEAVVPESSPHYESFQKLKAAGIEKMRELKETVTMTLQGRRDEALSIMASNRGQVLMRDIRVLAAGMNKAEFQYLSEARVSDIENRQTVTWIVIGFALATMIIGVLVVILISAQRRMAVEQNRELQELTAELTEARDAALAATKAKSRFLAAASHDLRQPLHALTLFISALERRVTDPDAAPIVGDLKVVGRSMNTMFNALLDISRIDAGVMDPAPVIIDLHEMLSKLADEYRLTAAEKGIKLIYVPCRAYIRTDREMLGSIVRNILSNAVKFTESGRILLGCRRQGRSVAIQIFDTGPGIAPEKLPLIFEEFERLGRSRRQNSDGLGLGLSIGRRMAWLLGSDITVRSRVGVGTNFSVPFPLVAGVKPAVVEAPVASRVVGDNRQVLVVDDDAPALAALSREIADQGFRVKSASTAEEALASLDPPPDLILMDLNLGDDDGIEVAEAINARLARPAAVVIISGATEPEAISRLDDSGVPWLTKPVDPAELQELLAVIVEG